VRLTLHWIDFLNAWRLIDYSKLNYSDLFENNIVKNSFKRLLKS
jgi:hypothetical protein